MREKEVGKGTNNRGEEKRRALPEIRQSWMGRSPRPALPLAGRKSGLRRGEKTGREAAGAAGSAGGTTAEDGI